jgi:hypothetical protein
MSSDADSQITTHFRVCDGVRVRYADTKADADVTTLLLAPWPEDLHLDPDVLLGNRAVAPLRDGHHAAPVSELADDAGPLAGPERDWVRHDLWRRAPD